MPSNSREYRPDIDGLRAIAVLSVVLFHINPNWMPGGFVGVDVFFVISGYLITRNIHNEVIGGRFSYSNFYLRRVRRLFPALFFTLFITAFLGFLLLAPNHLERLGKSIVYAAVSLSNFFFWDEAGYFDTSSNFKPLLHFWSLAVEEQFYFIWPAMVLGLLWPRRVWIVIGALCLLGVLSLMFSSHWMTIDQEAVFYLMPFRIFEFSIGALCVWLKMIPRKYYAANEAILLCGLGAIGYSVITFNELTPFPGFYALIPCLGAALAIYSGQAEFSGYLLRNKLAVGIGLISYSLYLIHWPMLVYYKYWKFDPISPVDQVGLIIAALILATWMYAYIEKPFRYNPYKSYRLKPATFAFRCATLLSLIILPAAHTWANLGWSWRISDDNNGILEQTKIDNHRDCRDDDAIDSFGYSCAFGARKSEFGRFNVVLLGDSHSKHWVPGLHELFSDNEISAINLGRGGVLPFLGGSTFEKPSSKVPMVDGNKKIHGYIEEIRPKVVVLSARWALYVNRMMQQNKWKEQPFFSYGDYKTPGPQSSFLSLERALIDTISRYRTLGIHTVLLGQVPPLGGSVKDCITRPTYLAKDNSIELCRAFSKRESLERLRSTNELLLRMNDKFGTSVSVLLPSEWLCGNNEYCDLFSDNHILYKDGDHLSHYGSVYLARKNLHKLVEIVEGNPKSEFYADHARHMQRL